MVNDLFKKAVDFFESNNIILAKDIFLQIISEDKNSQFYEQSLMYLVKIFDRQSDFHNKSIIEMHLIDFYKSSNEDFKLFKLIKEIIANKIYGHHDYGSLFYHLATASLNLGEIDQSKTAYNLLLMFYIKRRNINKAQEIIKVLESKKWLRKNCLEAQLQIYLIQGRSLETAELIEQIIQKTQTKSNKIQYKSKIFSLAQTVELFGKYQERLNKYPTAWAFLLSEAINVIDLNDKVVKEKLKYEILNAILQNPQSSYLILITAKFFYTLKMNQYALSCLDLFKSFQTKKTIEYFEKIEKYLDEKLTHVERLNKKTNNTNIWEKSEVTSVLKKIKGIGDALVDLDSELTEKEELIRNIQFLESIEENEKAILLAKRLKKIDPKNEIVKKFFDHGTKNNERSRNTIIKELQGSFFEYPQKLPVISIDQNFNELNDYENIFALFMDLKLYDEAHKLIDHKLSFFRNNSLKDELNCINLKSNAFLSEKKTQQLRDLLIPYLDYGPLKSDELANFLYLVGLSYEMDGMDRHALDTFRKVQFVKKNFRQVNLKVKKFEKN